MFQKILLTQHLKSRFGKGYQVELKVADVCNKDEDYLVTVKKLLTSCRVHSSIFEDESNIASASESILIRLPMVKSIVESLTNDSSISSLINQTDPSGYVIYKNARSQSGVSIDELAAFCVEEQRMKHVMDFMEEKYPNSAMRERQDNKLRFEVDNEGDLKISSLFEVIETSKKQLQLADYGISQTTLEQVFNMQAAEAAMNNEEGN